MDYLHRSNNDDDDDRRPRNKYRGDDRFNRPYHDRDNHGDDSRRRSRSRSPPPPREDRFYSGPKRFGNGGGEQREERRHNPSKTIMVRQIPLQMSEDDLRTEFNMVQVPYKHIRLVKHRENGQSRGFAFVEFGTVDEASRWMASNQGQFQLSSMDARLALFYSFTDEHTFRSEHMSSRRPNGGGFNPALSSEWTCSKCDVKNFKRRDRCFKCNMTREESDKRTSGEGYEHVGATPGNTLVLRGLDALTVEETIVDTLNSLSSNTLSVKTCHIARDPSTNVSDGFAFVEMNTIQDATYMLQVLAPYFEVDGKQIMANYSKNSFKTAISQLHKTPPAPQPPQQQLQQQQAQQQVYPIPGGYPYNHHHHHHHHHAAGNNGAGSGGMGVSQGDRVNSAAAVAQAALYKMQKKQEILNQITGNHLKDAPAGNPQPAGAAGAAANLDSTIGANLQLLAQQANKTYPPPDPSKFTFDKASGYYYDFSTGFYFDARTQYYYNPLTQQFMYWEPMSLTYIPVTATGAPADPAKTATDSTAAPAPPPPAEEPAAAVVTTKQPAKTAAQIAKDMEKWAQSQNKKKEAKKITITPVQSSLPPVASATTSASAASSLDTSGSSGAGFKTGLFDLTKTATISMSLNTSSTSSSIDNNLKKSSAFENDDASSNSDSDASNGEPPAVSARSQASAGEERTPTAGAGTGQVDESSLIDLAKMACLLCKRKFDTLDVLNKHVAKSDLHKTNLEKLKKETQASNKRQQEDEAEQDTLAIALQYRDRAKERRKKYGTPEPPSPTYSSSSAKPASKAKSARGNESEESPASSSSKPSSLTSGGSIASKLMRKMGWNGETGIGKNLQGISAPIEASMRQKGAGLGASNYELDPNDTYQDAVKRAARARFEQLNS